MDSTVTSDRVVIRGAIEAMAPEFATLVGEIGDEGWKTNSGIPAYTCGQLAWHLASGTSFLAGEIAKAKDGKALNPPAFLRPILYKMGEWRVRFASRKATPVVRYADGRDADDRRPVSEARGAPSGACRPHPRRPA